MGRYRYYLVIGSSLILTAVVIGYLIKSLGNPYLNSFLSHEFYTILYPYVPIRSFMLIISASASVLAVGVYLLVMLIYVVLKTPKDDVRRRYLILTIVALILADAVVALLKWSLRVPRPFWGSGFVGYTYPSGHVTRSAVVAYLAPKVFGGKLGRYLPLVTWSWVVLTCLSRVVLGAHYVIDTVGGVLIGLGTSLVIMSIYEFLRTNVVIIREEAVKRG